MDIVISSIKDIKKYNPYVDLLEFRNDKYFESKLLEYFQSFCEQVDKLKDRLDHKNDKEIDRLFKKIIKRRNSEEIGNILNHYNSGMTSELALENENHIAKLKEDIRLIKDIVLATEFSDMRRLQLIDNATGRMIDDVSNRHKVSESVLFDNLKIDELLASFGVSSKVSFSEYDKYVLCYRNILDDICNHYRKNYSVKAATRYIKKITSEFDKKLDDYAQKLDYLHKEKKLIDELITKYNNSVSSELYYDWVYQFKNEIEEMKSRYRLIFSSKMSEKFINLMDSKTSAVIDKNAKKSGFMDMIECRLKVIFDEYNPDKIDIFDMIFYSNEAKRDEAKEKYKGMTLEEKNVFEMRIYEQYIRNFKARIRECNRIIRRIFSSKCANKIVASVNKRADKLIRDKAIEINKPIPRNPWFIRKYLWADNENFATGNGVKFRKIINPFMRNIVKVAMKNSLIVEERSQLDSTKQYVFVPTHYFTEDIIGEYASLGRQAYMVMGTTDQIENNFLMLAAIALGLIYVDREDSVNRKECVEKQNRIIEMGSNVVNYVGGSWENSENELQPLSFSGPYRTCKEKNVQLVPVGLYFVKEEKKIYVRYGNPIDVSKYDESTANEIIRDTLASMHFKQMSKYSHPIETVEIEDYGKTHNLPYNQHISYMEQVANEYWNQYWSKPFAKEEIGLRSKKVVDEADVYSFVDKLSREKLIELSWLLSEPMLRRYERDERYNIVKYIDENYDRLRNKHSKVKKRVKRK